MPRRKGKERINNVPIGAVHVDVALSNLSLTAMNADNIIRKILVPFPSDRKSNVVYKYGNELFLSEDDVRAAGADAHDATPFKLTTVSYSCGGHALKEKIARDTENNADPALDLMQDAVRIRTGQSSLNEEVAGVAALVAGLTGTSVADQAATPWNSADFDPYKFLKGEIDTVTTNGGVPPNLLSLARPVWTAVRTNPNVVGLVTGAPQVTNAQVTLAQFAELLEIDEVLVGRAVYQTSLTGAKKFVWGQKALLSYRPKSPGLRTPAMGYTPVWTNALAAVTGLEKVPGMDGQGDQFVQTYFWEPEVADYVVVHRYYDQQIWMPELGKLYTGCLGTANA